MVQQQSDVNQLATWCIVYRRELSRKKDDCRRLQESLRDIKKELETTKTKLAERMSDLASAREQSRCLEEDLTNQDRQITTLKKKIEVLQTAIGSPSNTAASLAHRLINESPAPFDVMATKKPKLSAPSDSLGKIDLDLSADLFDDSAGGHELSFTLTPEPPSGISPSGQSTAVKSSKNDSELTVQNVKITSAADSKLSHRDVSGDVVSIPHQGGILGFNIMKRQQFSGGLVSMSAVFKQGYNGLGGHEKVVEPRPRIHTTLTGGFKRPKNVGPMKKLPLTERQPPLPNLMDFETN